MDYLLYILGMSTMFFGMMTFFFAYKGERLHKLVSLLTATIALECVRDFAIIALGFYTHSYMWKTITAFDMVVVPMYAFVLIELVKPEHIAVRSMVLSEIPFVLFPLLYVVTANKWFFYLSVGWAAVYGTGYMLWTAVNIPRYNRQLMERFSYTENINLNWLKTILYMFYFILGLWIFDCVVFHLDMECLYLLLNLVLWIVISLFLSRHESVIEELTDYTPEQQHSGSAGQELDVSLAKRIEALFGEEKVFLNSSLKLSDVARAVGSNRTYVSQYFNRDAASSFYDYVNKYRVEYACSLLADETLSVQDVAFHSGFGSASSFSRVFVKHMGCTPTAYRHSLM